jgi:hypothetical protein
LARYLYARSLYRLSWQDLFRRFLHKLSTGSLSATSLRDLLARFLQQISTQVSVQDLYKRSLGKIFVQDLYGRSLGISKQSLKTSFAEISAKALYKRPPCQDLCARFP